MSILVLTSDTLIGTPATGNLEYNGQFYGTDSNASRAQMQRITQGTAVASTSGTSIDFTGLPAWCKRITVMFAGVSTSGTSVPMLRLGTSGGIESTGYGGSETTCVGVNAGSYTKSISTGFDAAYDWSGPEVIGGQYIVSLIGSNIWVCTWTFGHSNGARMQFGGGTKTLSGTLDRIRLTTANGTDTFDAGTINIMYEG